MSLRNRFALLFVSTLFLAFMVACGSSSSSPAPVPPPSGSFSNSNLNGTYVFSVSGYDVNGAPYSIVGTFTASGGSGNGTAGISGGTLDITDEDTDVFVNGPIANTAIGSNSTYTVSVDGRGEAFLTTSTPFGTIKLDFVLQDSSHGLVTEFDNNASGSGTLDLQSSGITPNGAYAFSFSGADISGNPFATVGDFTVSGGTITAGLEDFNDDSFAYTNQLLSGSVVAGPSSTPSTILATGQFGGLTFDVYPISATQLKFIEMDGINTFSGDAYSQPSTALPTSSTIPFVLEGVIADSPAGAGGFMVTDNNGNPTDSSSEDINNGGSASPSPLPFSGTYTAGGTGRYTLALSGFSNGAGGFLDGFVAYPSSAGIFLLEVDDAGLMSGSGYPAQSSTTFASAEGYGLNFTGINISAEEELGEAVEVDDIAEFTASASSTSTCSPGSVQGGSNTDVVSGLDDENYAPDGAPIPASVICGNFAAPDSNGRGQIGTVTENNTLNGGFLLNFYSVDGTTFPFIETDDGQVAAGVMFEQNASDSASAAAKLHHAYVMRPLPKAHAARQKQQKKK
ncbi:MAG TPA: hypothetical protein VMD99_02110 [Terriglobales bacterium]|nr:hypothetical protein [Terriglobales bacterium]